VRAAVIGVTAIVVTAVMILVLIIVERWTRN
jgi:hypothetical protein